jgi:hypothetical protein
MLIRKIITTLSTPAASIAIIVIAVAARIFLQIHFLNTDNDKSFQLQAAKNFIEGNGVTLNRIGNDDLSIATYEPLTMWPPGYSIAVSPFAFISKNNLVLASILLDIITCIAFVLIARRLFQLFNLPPWYLNIYTLLTGFFLYKYCTASSSDFLTLTIFLIALYSGLMYFQANRLSFWQAFLFCVLLSFCPALRYQYLGITMAIPFCFLLIGWLNKDNLQIRKGAISVIITFLLTVIMIIVQYRNSGNSVYLPKGEIAITINKLIELHPFLFSSVINLDVLTPAINHITGISVQSIYFILAALHLMLLLFLVAITIRLLFKKRMLDYISTNRYLFTAAVTSIVSAGTIIILSVFYLPYTDGVKGVWTYIMEPRYFAIPVFFTQQAVFYFAYKYRNYLQKYFVLLVSICLLTLLHDIYYTIKIPFTAKGILKYPESPGLIKYTNHCIDSLEMNNQFSNGVVIARPAFAGSHAGFYKNIPALYKFIPFDEVDIHTSREIPVLLVIKNHEKLPQVPGNQALNLIGTYNAFRFYLTKALPD